MGHEPRNGWPATAVTADSKFRIDALIKLDLNKLRERIRAVRPNRNMKDVLLLHDNAWPHTSLRTREATANMRWTVLPHSTHSPDLAPSDSHLFGLETDALRGRHFGDDNQLKQSFRDVPRSRGTGFLHHWYTASYSTLASVLKITETLWKNSPTTAKAV
jgi:hypothetical protein